VRVALVQMASGLDKTANRAAAAAGVRQAAGEGATVVVLPEAAMAGFGSPRTDLSELAEPLDGPFTSTLCAVAGATGTTVVAGTFEPAPDGRVYNTVVVISGSGLLARYRKVHLYDALGWCESDRVCPGEPGGDNVPVVEVGELALGVITCYDLRFPESARMAAVAGATAVAVPAAWVAGPHKVEHWRTLLRARAVENTAYVIAAAQPAPTYTGYSAVIDPMGVVRTELGPGDRSRPPELAWADLDRSCLAAARSSLPVLAHRRFSVTPDQERDTMSPTGGSRPGRSSGEG
jgi:predicted amidohydrolase